MRTIRGLSLVVLAAFLLTASLASAQEISAAECRPECRAGYTCIDGACVSACNPPCASDEKCTAERECVPKATTSTGQGQSGAGATQGPATTAPPSTITGTTAPLSSESQPIVDNRAEVERAVEMDVGDQHSDWLQYESVKTPTFSNYMYKYYDKKRRNGVILAAAIGPAILVVGAGIAVPLAVYGGSIQSSCADKYNSGEANSQPPNMDAYYSCREDSYPPLTAALIVAGTMGATALVVIIVGSVRIHKNKVWKQKVAEMSTTALREPRLEFVGLAPLPDMESKLSGLALHLAF